jgi:hypothetical protein
LQLLKIDRDIIKKLRVKYPQKILSEFTVSELLGELCPNEFALAQSLTRPFYAVTET